MDDLDEMAVHPAARRGRGAVSNESGRFEQQRRSGFDDGWDPVEAPPPLRTSLIRDSSRSIIARNSSPDVGFNRSINPYRGCEHGCAYCFARPTHTYLGYSAGLDFESKILFKADAAGLLEKAFRKPGYRPEVIALGVNTDAYQPAEKSLRIARGVLQVMADFQHPVCIVTKAHLVTRDIDILAPLAAAGLAKVMVSVTTLERQLARRMEPRAATPERRLDAIRQLARAGIPTGVLAAPMIPALNDHEMEDILQQAADAGATEASYILLRLPHELARLWRQWLEANYPDRAARVMGHIRSARGGKDYDSRFHHRMTGSGPYADLLAKRFELAARKLNLTERKYELDCGKFRVPVKENEQRQLSLL